jgi:Flp pilus assembly secretin CpaC
MITTEEQNIHRKVPFLGDIPLLGRLFRYDKTSLARKELLIFLTPQLVICDADSEVQKTIEMQRIEINMDRATQMHGPLLDQNRFAPSEGMQIVPGSEFIVPNSIESNKVPAMSGQASSPIASPIQNGPMQSSPMQNSPVR